MTYDIVQQLINPLVPPCRAVPVTGPRLKPLPKRWLSLGVKPGGFCVVYWLNLMGTSFSNDTQLLFMGAHGIL